MPLTSVLSTPSNGSVDANPNGYITWQLANNVSSYLLQIATVSNFSSTVYNMSGLTYPYVVLATALPNNRAITGD